VDAGERLVLYCLASHVNTHGLCWPSRETIARETSQTERGVIRILKRLEQKRIIYRVAQGGERPHSCARYEWPDFLSFDAMNAKLAARMKILSEPPQPGSFDDLCTKMPQASAPVAKLANKLETQLMRIKTRRRSLGSKMSYRLGVQANDIKIRAGINPYSDIAI
jgi:hypothetical protein